jgi:hypothetical protein
MIDWRKSSRSNSQGLCVEVGVKWSDTDAE